MSMFRNADDLAAEALRQRAELYEALAYLMAAHGEQLHDAFDMAQKALAKAEGRT